MMGMLQEVGVIVIFLICKEHESQRDYSVESTFKFQQDCYLVPMATAYNIVITFPKFKGAEASH